MRCERRRKNGEPCKGQGVTGTEPPVCRMHGGGAPQVKAKAAMRVAEAKARRALLDLGEPEPVTNALQALQSLAGDLLRLKDELRRQVEQLDEVRYKGVTSEQIRGELAAYQGALRDTAMVLGLIAKLGLDERLVAIEEQQVDVLETALLAALADMGMGESQQLEAIGHVERHLGLAATNAA